MPFGNILMLTTDLVSVVWKRLYREGRKKCKVLRPTFQVIENIEFGLRMTNLGGLFLCERPLHHVILRPTLVIQPS